MLAVGEIARTLYEQILSLHEFVDPNISKQFYMDRLESFKQLPLLLEDMLFMFTNVSSKVRQLVLNIKPKRTYTVEKTDLQITATQESFPTQIHTESDIRKKLAITSLGFGQNILRQKSLNTKQIRRQKQSQQVMRESKQFKQNRNSKEFGEVKELPQLPEFRQTRELHRPPAVSSVKKIRKHSVEEEKDNSRCESRDPYCDQQIYMQSAHLNTIRNRKKDHPRKKRILSICIKGQNTPNMFIS